MIKSLTEDTIAECQAKFNLSYHVHYAHTCETLIGFEGKDVLEVGGSLPKEFVFDYLHVNSWSAIETPDYEENLKEVGGLSHQGTIINQTKSDTNLGFYNRELGQYNFFLGNIEDLPDEHYGKYDLIFSIAAFEHIQKLPQALEKMFLSLKLGGQLFSAFAPVWSSFNGHHLPEITDEQGQTFSFENSPIPPWGHLLMRPGELCNYLYQKTDKKTADLIEYYVNRSPHINRLFIEDYIDFVNQTEFEINQVKPIFFIEIPINIQQQLQKLYSGRKDFTHEGLLLILNKTENFANQELKSSILNRLRTVNLITCPDWNQPEEKLYSQLSSVILQLFNHPQADQISLFIDNDNNDSISEVDTPNLILSAVLMNLLMEKDAQDEEVSPEIVLTGQLNSEEWEGLINSLNYRIILEQENQELSNPKIAMIPSLTLDSFSKEFSQKSKEAKILQESKYELEQHSYLGEEYIIDKYLNQLDEVNEYCVDIAASDGLTMSNTYFLWKRGWSGLAVEYNSQLFSKLSCEYAKFENVNLSKTMVTPDNVLFLLKTHQVPKQFGLLSLDIDGYDYFVLEQILSEFRPALICTEINEKIRPPLKFTVKWDANYTWANDHFCGQSISQLYLLCQKYQYFLVELYYNNAFLIPREISPYPGLDPETAYCQGYLHKPDRKQKFPWNADMEKIHQLSDQEALEFVNSFFSRYKGQFICEL